MCSDCCCECLVCVYCILCMVICSLDRLVDEATVDSECLSKRRMVCLCGVLVCVIGVLVGGLSCV